ncbi:hypothetical protein O6P43_033136, partial [Quillaja saponaria]
QPQMQDMFCCLKKKPVGIQPIPSRNQSLQLPHLHLNLHTATTMACLLLLPPPHVLHLRNTIATHQKVYVIKVYSLIKTKIHTQPTKNEIEEEWKKEDGVEV